MSSDIYAPGPLIPETGFIRRLVDFMEPFGEVPKNGHAMAGMTAVSAALGGKSYVAFSGGVEPTQTWVLVSAPTGARKTTAIRTARNLCKLGQSLRGGLDAHPPELALTDEERFEWLQVGKPRHLSDAGLYEMLAPPKWTGEAAEKEAKAAYYEDLGPPSTLMELDEAGRLFVGNGRNDDWQGETRQAFLGLAGGELDDQHKSGHHVKGAKVAVTLIAAMTDRQLRGAPDPETLVSSGWLGRWLVLPMGDPPRFLAFPDEDPTSLREFRELARWIGDLALSDRRDRIENANHPRHRTDGAHAIYAEWYTLRGQEAQDIAVLNGQADPLEVWRASYLNRARGIAWKLALHQAVARTWKPGKRLSETVVDEDDVFWGIGVVEASAAYLFEDVLGGIAGPAEEYQERALAWLRARIEQGEGPVKTRDLLRGVRAQKLNGNDTATKRRALEALQGVSLEFDDGPNGSEYVELLAE